MKYYNNLKYCNRKASLNTADPDQMLQKVDSDQGLYYLPLIYSPSDIILKVVFCLLLYIGEANFEHDLMQN